jgi:uncharacterized membrane protein
MPPLKTLAAPMILASLALCACGKDRNPDAHPPVPDTASNFAQPFDARGADPAWGLTIRGNQLALTRAGQPTLAGTAPGATIQDHSATWAVTLPESQTMTVNLYASACADPQSGTTYAYAAEVILPDKSSLVGCGGPPAKLQSVKPEPAQQAAAKR